MVTAGTGAITTKEDVLAASLSRCAEFITWTGEINATAALTHVHFDALPDPADGNVYTDAELDALRPYVILFTDRAGGLIKSHVSTSGSGFDFADSGALLLHFVQEAADGQSIAEQERLFKNSVGKIINQLCVLAGTGGESAFGEIALDDDGERQHPDFEDSDQLHWMDVRVGYSNAL